MEISHHQFKVHSFDSDGFGALTADRLLGYLLESAGRSADALGFGIEKLQAKGLTWVLGRIQIVVDLPIRACVELRVRQRCVLEDHRARVGCSVRVRLDPVVDAAKVRYRRHGAAR